MILLICPDLQAAAKPEAPAAQAAPPDLLGDLFGLDAPAPAAPAASVPQYAGV